MVAEMHTGGLEANQPQAAADGDIEDDRARREEVARSVSELEGAFGAREEKDAPAGGDDKAQRVDVASMVAQMRAELSSGATNEANEAMEPADPDAEVRDEVRRAVDAARAEMAPGYTEADEAGGGEDSKFSFTDWQSAHVEPSGPPVIVIKDSEGRVELARIYETLSRVHCDENAALLNYTPHSVTVGLNIRATVPEAETLAEAVKAVFGRACQVDSDGVRLNVQIGKDLQGKDSAA